MKTLPKTVSILFSVFTIPGKDQQFMQAGQVIGKMDCGASNKGGGLFQKAVDCRLLI